MHVRSSYVLFIYFLLANDEPTGYQRGNPMPRHSTPAALFPASTLISGPLLPVFEPLHPFSAPYHPSSSSHPLLAPLPPFSSLNTRFQPLPPIFLPLTTCLQHRHPFATQATPFSSTISCSSSRMDASAASSSISNRSSSAQTHVRIIVRVFLLIFFSRCYIIPERTYDYSYVRSY